VRVQKTGLQVYFARALKVWGAASTRRKKKNKGVQFQTRDGLLLLASIGIFFVLVFAVYFVWIEPRLRGN
jgi:hypothetical protein